MASGEIILHGTELSGHVHRVELLLRMLGLPYRFVAAPATVRAAGVNFLVVDQADLRYPDALVDPRRVPLGRAPVEPAGNRH